MIRPACMRAAELYVAQERLPPVRVRGREQMVSAAQRGKQEWSQQSRCGA